MNLYKALGRPRTEAERSDLPLSLDDWAQMFSFGGLQYPVVQSGGTPPGGEERISGSFAGYVDGAYKRNGVVFACIAARQLLFSEARFQFRQIRNGRPGDLFGTAALAPLETPWTNATTGDLLTRAIVDADIAGNHFSTRRGTEVRRLRPDWVTIVAGSKTGSEIDTEVIGYAYQPGGPGSGEPVEVLFPEMVAHFAPYPDPLARFRGMSWLQPIVSEIDADQAATTHKRSFFENGATLGYVVTLDSGLTPQQFEEWVTKFREGHERDINAYKTLFLAGGADVKTVGADFRQIDFKQVQGGGETRICAAARVPPIIVGVSEGLEAATYANYGQARRAFADLTMRPMWRNVAGSFASLIQAPPGSELWYDDRDIPFLQEDVKDAADIQQAQAITLRELINAGWEPNSAKDAVMSGDFGRLAHTGLVSVQLQPPGADPGALAPAKPQPQLPPGK